MVDGWITGKLYGVWRLFTRDRNDARTWHLYVDTLNHNHSYRTEEDAKAAGVRMWGEPAYDG